jgi:hypothetical protein
MHETLGFITIYSQFAENAFKFISKVSLQNSESAPKRLSDSTTIDSEIIFSYLPLSLES